MKILLQTMKYCQYLLQRWRQCSSKLYCMLFISKFVYKDFCVKALPSQRCLTRINYFPQNHPGKSPFGQNWSPITEFNVFGNKTVLNWALAGVVHFWTPLTMIKHYMLNFTEFWIAVSFLDVSLLEWWKRVDQGLEIDSIDINATTRVNIFSFG